MTEQRYQWAEEYLKVETYKDYTALVAERKDKLDSWENQIHTLLRSFFIVLMNKALPWQAMILLVLYFLNIIFLMLDVFTLPEITSGGNEMIQQYLEEHNSDVMESVTDAQMQEMIAVVEVAVKWFFLVAIGLTMVLVWGLYSGKRWALWVVVVFSVFGLMNAAFASSFLSLLFSGGTLYLAVMCLQDQYFAKQ